MNARGRSALRSWTWLLTVSLALLSGSAMALGLGQIRVLSGPGQPLLAEIPIVSNEPGELENARARLASPDTFARVGLQPPQGLVRDLQFEITQDAQGRAVVRVTSDRPVDVAAVAFLIEVDWGQGRLVREYSALVAAPQTAAAIEAPAIQAPQAAPADIIVREPAPVSTPAPIPTAPPAAPVAEAPAVPPPPAPMAVAGGEVLAQVERGQTLSTLAAGMDRGGHTLNQAMLALLRANPEAFVDGNIHRLRAGAVMRMPAAGDFAEADAATASALVREQTAQWRQSRRPIQQPAESAGAAASAPTTATAAIPVIPTGGARLEIAPAAADAGTQATRSGLGAGGEDGDMLANEQLRQAQEDIATRDSELQELRGRVEELEKLQQQQAQLIALKDSDLAAAQARLSQLDAGAGDAAGGGVPLWLFGGLALLIAAAAVWWLARRPKPLPIPVARAGGGGFDAASLTAAVPEQTGADPGLAVDAPEEAHHVPAPAVAPEPGHDRAPEPAAPAAPRAYPAAWQPDASAVPAWHTDDVSAPLAPLNPAPAGRERLELAIAYLDLGDAETARTLLREVANGQDPAARDEALQLLREIG